MAIQMSTKTTSVGCMSVADFAARIGSSYFWRCVERLIHRALPRRSSLGRPRASWKSMVCGIYYRLWSGCPWRALPHAFGAPSTVHGWFQLLNSAGIWKRLHHLVVTYCRRHRHREECQPLLLLDGSIIKAPLGGDLAGPSPVHRSRLGSKRSILTDSKGLPVAVIVGPANRHDSQLLVATLQACKIPLRGSLLIADKAYYGRASATAAARVGTQLIVPVKEGGSMPANTRRLLGYRWRVERTFAWLNQWRGLATRYDRKAANYLGMLHLASAWCWIRFYKL